MAIDSKAMIEKLKQNLLGGLQAGGAAPFLIERPGADFEQQQFLGQRRPPMSPALLGLQGMVY